MQHKQRREGDRFTRADAARREAEERITGEVIGHFDDGENTPIVAAPPEPPRPRPAGMPWPEFVAAPEGLSLDVERLWVAITEAGVVVSEGTVKSILARLSPSSGESRCLYFEDGQHDDANCPVHRASSGESSEDDPSLHSDDAT